MAIDSELFHWNWCLLFLIVMLVYQNVDLAASALEAAEPVRGLLTTEYYYAPTIHYMQFM